MLNKNQSHKRNSWKYAIVVPALIGFIFLFQVKTIAQEKEEERTFTREIHKGDNIRVTVNKNTSDAEMKKEAANLKKDHGITLKYSKVKRNSNGEITGIKVEFKDKDGNKGVSQVDGKEPISPIHFYKNDSGVGFGKPRQMSVYSYSRGGNDNEPPMAVVMGDSIATAGNFDFDFDFDFDTPEAPEAPELPEAPEALSWGDNQNVVIKTDGDKKPMVIINGKVLKDDKEIEEAMKKYGVKGKSVCITADSDGQKVFINGNDVMKIRKDAMADARIQMKRMKPEMKRQIELVKANKGQMKAEMARARAEMDRNRAEMEASKPEMEAAKAEMNRVKEEMLKAKAEMEAAKAEYEKAKADLKNKK